MDARIRGTVTSVPTELGDRTGARRRGSVSDRTPDLDREIATPLAGLRVALVHDWLTGMRGGEKCLEVLCRTFPEAELYTLIHRRGALSPAIEAMTIRTSPLQLIPGVVRHYRHLLPIMPLAARAWRLKNVDLVISLSHCVAKAVVPPPGVPHVCYCFTPMRYAWQGRDTYLESWSDRPVRRALARRMLTGLRRWDLATAEPRDSFRGDLGNDPRANRPMLQPRKPCDSAPRERQLLQSDSPRAARRLLPGGVGAGPVQANRSGGSGLHRSRAGV